MIGLASSGLPAVLKTKIPAGISTMPGGAVRGGAVDRSVALPLPHDGLELLMIPQADQMRAWRDIHFEERAFVSFGPQAEDRENGLVSVAPAVGPQAVLERRHERLPGRIEKRRRIRPQQHGRPAEVAKLLADPVGPARPHGIDLRLSLIHI